MHFFFFFSVVALITLKRNDCKSTHLSKRKPNELFSIKATRKAFKLSEY